MKVSLDFNLEAWIQNVDIDAASVEEAKEMLMNMSLAEIVESYYYTVKELNITDVTSEVIERDLEVQVTNIKYDLNDVSEDDVDDYLEKEALLPTLLLTLAEVGADEDLVDIIDDAIYFETGHWTTSFDYEILSEK